MFVGQKSVYGFGMVGCHKLDHHNVCLSTWEARGLQLVDVAVSAFFVFNTILADIVVDLYVPGLLSWRFLI